MTSPDARGAAPSGAACRRCGAALRADRRPAATATDGPVEVAVPPRTRGVCPAGHPDRTEAEAARAALTAVPTARAAGPRLLRRTAPERCGACGTTLDLPARRTVRGVTVEPAGAPPYLLELALPLVRCPDCAVDNVPAAVAPAVRRAVLTALA